MTRKMIGLGDFLSETYLQINGRLMMLPHLVPNERLGVGGDLTDDWRKLIEAMTLVRDLSKSISTRHWAGKPDADSEPNL